MQCAGIEQHPPPPLFEYSLSLSLATEGESDQQGCCPDGEEESGISEGEIRRWKEEQALRGTARAGSYEERQKLRKNLRDRFDRLCQKERALW